MSQSGYTPIQLYYSITPGNRPVAANLVQGELALNIPDGKLYYKDTSNNIQQFVSGAGPTGPTGPTGPLGPTGPTGPQGIVTTNFTVDQVSNTLIFYFNGTPIVSINNDGVIKAKSDIVAYTTI